MTYDEQLVNSPFTDIIWNKVVSQKVSFIALLLLNKMILTKDNLVQRGAFHLGSLLCYGGCGKNESINRWSGISLSAHGRPLCTGWRFLVCFTLTSTCMRFSLGALTFTIRKFFIISKLCGWDVFGSFGRNIIWGFFRTSRHPSLRCLIEWSFIRDGGWCSQT